LVPIAIGIRVLVAPIHRGLFGGSSVEREFMAQSGEIISNEVIVG